MFLTTPSMTWPSSRFCTSSWRCSARVSSSTVRRDTTMLPRRRSIFRIWNGCGWFISGVDVADRTDVDLRARQERHRAVEIDGEAALDLVEDDALDLLVVLEGLLELAPALLAARLVAREHGFAERVLDALEIDLDGVADLEVRLPARSGEFAQRHAAFGLGADVDDGDVLLDADDGPLDDGAFLQTALGEGLFEHLGEIFARRRGETGGSGHELSSIAVDDFRLAHVLIGKPATTFPGHALAGVSCAGWKAPRDPRHPPWEQRPDDRALETMIAVRRTTEEAGGAGSSSNDGSAVSRTPGLLGQLRQCRWRPGTRVYIELCRARQGHCSSTRHRRAGDPPHFDSSALSVPVKTMPGSCSIAAARQAMKPSGRTSTAPDGDKP